MPGQPSVVNQRRPKPKMRNGFEEIAPLEAQDVK